jgi:hypothetical protein
MARYAVAKVFGAQRYYLAAAPGYLSRFGAPQSPSELNQHPMRIDKVIGQD